MALKTRVKVSHVTNLHDARYCAGMGVEIIGLPVDPQMPGYVPPPVFEEMAGWLSGLHYAGELQTVDNLELHNYNLQYLETSVPGHTDELKRYSLPVVLRMNLEQPGAAEVTDLMNLYHEDVAFFLLEIPASWQEHTRALQQICQQFTVFLGGAINSGNLEQLLQKCQPAGLELKPGKEIKTGLNDFDELANALELLDTDEFL